MKSLSITVSRLASGEPEFVFTTDTGHVAGWRPDRLGNLTDPQLQMTARELQVVLNALIDPSSLYTPENE